MLTGMGMQRKHRGDPAGGDPFLEDFFRDMSPALAHSFTDEQLLEIKKCFAGRTRGAHTVDLRFSIPLLRRYVVLLMGRERRSRKRRNHDRKFHPVGTLGNLFAIAVVAVVLAVPVFVVGYGVKSYLGINMVSAGGVHSMIEDLRRDLVMVIKDI
ncbi:MAG: hypothetical protein JJ899_07530 [Alphaproteobacteria bacterium]|nr:hypothetical protein [Alphaproteobacteria bacterium]